jgi:hypothetical protein
VLNRLERNGGKETAGKKRDMAGKKREMDLCRVLFIIAHGKALFAVFFLKWHMAKTTLPCSLLFSTRRRFRGKMLPTCSFALEKLAGGGGVRGRRSFAVFPLGAHGKVMPL